MTVAPVQCHVDVAADPHRAFDLFVDRIDLWWPKSRFIGKAPPASVHLERGAGGRWFERDAEGRETNWGRVLVWAPPSRLVLAWQINAAWTYDPELVTEVELAFAPRAGGGTRVSLEHRKLELMGVDATTARGQLGGGWPTILRLYADLSPTTS